MNMRSFFTVSMLAISIALTACAELKQAGQTVGHTSKDVATDIGHASRDVAKDISRGTKRIVAEIAAEEDEPG